MSAMTYRGYWAHVEFDAEDEIFFGRIAGIRDGVSFHADNVADLKTAFHEAVDDYVASCAKLGRAPNRSFSGNLMLRVDPRVHALASTAAEASGKSLNQWSEEALEKAARAVVS